MWTSTLLAEAGSIINTRTSHSQGVAVGTGYDPFFGFYRYAVGTNVVVASYSVNKPGIDAGLGMAFGSKWHGRFFAEARFNRIFNGAYHTDYLPVTFGFRW
jgi:hypothetical protein